MTYTSKLLSIGNFDKMLGHNLDLLDHMEAALRSANLFSEASLTTSSYPPDNIVKVADGVYRIELALAGWNENELKISQYEENKATYLKVEGDSDSSEKGKDIEFVHKGISRRKFSKRYIIPQNTEITEVSFVNGLLAIELVVPKPESEKTRKEFSVGFFKKKK